MWVILRRWLGITLLAHMCLSLVAGLSGLQKRKHDSDRFSLNDLQYTIFAPGYKSVSNRLLVLIPEESWMTFEKS